MGLLYGCSLLEKNKRPVIIGDLGKAAPVTGVYMSAQRGSPAIHNGPGSFPLHRS